MDYYAGLADTVIIETSVCSGKYDLGTIYSRRQIVIGAGMPSKTPVSKIFPFIEQSRSGYWIDTILYLPEDLSNRLFDKYLDLIYKTDGNKEEAIQYDLPGRPLPNFHAVLYANGTLIDSVLYIEHIDSNAIEVFNMLDSMNIGEVYSCWLQRLSDN